MDAAAAEAREKTLAAVERLKQRETQVQAREQAAADADARVTQVEERARQARDEAVQ